MVPARSPVVGRIDGSLGFGVFAEHRDYEHQVVSGIGKMAMAGEGTGDIFVAMGKNIIETPGRVLDAAERGDYFAFGAEAMNLYSLGRGAQGLARAGVSSISRGLSALPRSSHAAMSAAIHELEANPPPTRVVAPGRYAPMELKVMGEQTVQRDYGLSAGTRTSRSIPAVFGRYKTNRLDAEPTMGDPSIGLPRAYVQVKNIAQWKARDVHQLMNTYVASR